MVYTRRAKRSKMVKSKVSQPVKKYVKNVVRKAIETEYGDYSLSIASATAATDSTGSIIALDFQALAVTTTPPNGDFVEHVMSRIRIHAKSFQHVNSSTPGDQTETNLRMILFRTKENSANQPPTVADILEFASWDDFPNHENRADYQIVMDRTLQLDPNMITDITTATQAQFGQLFTSQTAQQVHRNVKGSYKIGSGNNNTGINTHNQLNLLLISDQAMASAPSVDITYRVMFKDA